jgi:hypothetical protein
MLFKVESDKPLDEIERGLQESAARNQVGIIAMHDLKETLANKGVEFGPAMQPAPSQESFRRRRRDSDGLALPHFGMRNTEPLHAGDNAAHRDDAGVCDAFR